MTLQVWASRLRSTAAAWDDRSDDLSGAGKTLTGADPALLGPRVAPVAATFVTTWSRRIDALRARADAHSAALTETAAELATADGDTVEAMQRLMAWEDRDVAPAPRAGGRR